jgi:hypothetical protein
MADYDLLIGRLPELLEGSCFGFRFGVRSLKCINSLFIRNDQSIRTDRKEVCSRHVQRTSPTNIPQIRIRLKLPRKRNQNLLLLLMRLSHIQPDQFVKTPRPQERLVEQIWAVRCSYHKHIRSLLRPVQLRKELTHNSVYNAAGVRATPSSWSQGVDLIKEQDTRLRLPRPLKHIPYILLAFADVHV